MPVASTIRSPRPSISRPAGSANAIRRNANALMTDAAAAVPTPKLRANSGSAGATMPNPRATKNATTTSTPTSRGRSATGERGTRRSSHQQVAAAPRQDSPPTRRTVRRPTTAGGGDMVRRLARLTGVAALALPGVLLFGPAVSAVAATGQPGVLQSAWYWQTA